MSYTSVRTDADGRALVPVTPGSEYLLDTVVMQPAPEPQAASDPLWLSYWASLTFQVPAKGAGGGQ